MKKQGTYTVQQGSVLQFAKSISVTIGIMRLNERVREYLTFEGKYADLITSKKALCDGDVTGRSCRETHSQRAAEKRVLQVR